MDKREEILLKEFDVQSEDCQTWAEDIQLAVTLNPDVNKIKNAMDENGRVMCLDLLEFIAKNEVECTIDKYGFVRFYHDGRMLTKEELFDYFL